MIAKLAERNDDGDELDVFYSMVHILRLNSVMCAMRFQRIFCIQKVVENDICVAIVSARYEIACNHCVRIDKRRQEQILIILRKKNAQYELKIIIGSRYKTILR